MSAGRFQPVVHVPLPEGLRAQLDVLGARVRQAERRHAAARLALTITAALVGWLAIDYWVVTGAFGTGAWDYGGRAALTAALIALVVQEARSGLLAALRRERSDDDLAMLLEAAHPALDGRYISTVQLVRELNEGAATRVASPVLVQALAEDTEHRTATVDPQSAWDVQPAKRVAGWAAAAAVVVIALAAWRHDITGAFLRRFIFLAAQYPTATRILSVEAPGLVGRGDPVVITVAVDATSEVPPQAEAAVRTADGSPATVRLERVEGDAPAGSVLFRGSFPQAVEDLRIRPRAGDHRWNDWLAVRVLRRPAVKDLALHLDYPGYLKRPAGDSAVGDLDVPVGTRITVKARLSRPVAKATLAIKRGATAPEDAAMALTGDNGAAEGSFTVDADGAWSINLVDAEGLDAGQPPVWTIVARPDRAPTITVSFPPRDLDVTRMARWPIRFTAADDHGVARVQLRWRVVPPDGDIETATGEPAAAVVTGATSSGSSPFKGEHAFDLAPLNCAAGSRVVWWLEAEDARTPQSNVTASRRGVFTVIDAAEMRERLMQERQELLNAVKELRDRQKEARDGVEDVRKGMKP